MQDSDKAPVAAHRQVSAKRRKSRKNARAVTHGITSANPVIPGVEDPRDWQDHLEGILESLQPEGRLEHVLARRIALSLWQLTRVDRHIAAVTAAFIENGDRGPLALLPIPTGLEDLVESHMDKHPGQPEAPRRSAASSKPAEGWPEAEASSSDRHAVAERLIPRNSELKKIIRYEAHLHRVIDRNLRALEALQSKRLGVKVYLHRHL